MVYEELGDEDIGDFLRLYKLAKAKGMGVQQVIHLLKVANNNLPEIEWRYERLQREVPALEFKKQRSHIALSHIVSQIRKQSQAFYSYHIYCENEKSKIGCLQNEKIAIENLVTLFKNNNEEYLKIKQAAEDKVKSVLSNSKLLLQFAIFSVIESLRSNPELYNFVIHDNPNNITTTISYGPNYYPSLISSGRQNRQQQSFNDSYTALILEEAEKLYNILTTELTNIVMAAAAGTNNNDI